MKPYIGLPGPLPAVLWPSPSLSLAYLGVQTPTRTQGGQRTAGRGPGSPMYGFIKEDGLNYLEGPSTQYLRTLVPKAIEGMVFGIRVLKYCVLGPSGLYRDP